MDNGIVQKPRWKEKVKGLTHFLGSFLNYPFYLNLVPSAVESHG
jgi:hypothetical protein